MSRKHKQQRPIQQLPPQAIPVRVPMVDPKQREAAVRQAQREFVDTLSRELYCGAMVHDKEMSDTPARTAEWAISAARVMLNALVDDHKREAERYGAEQRESKGRIIQ